MIFNDSAVKTAKKIQQLPSIMSYSPFSSAFLVVPQTYPLFAGREATSLPISLFLPTAHPSGIPLLCFFPSV
jgi:hypothetical protein